MCLQPGGSVAEGRLFAKMKGVADAWIAFSLRAALVNALAGRYAIDGVGNNAVDAP